MNHDLTIPVVVTTEQCHDVIDNASSYIGYWECGFRGWKHDDEKRVISLEVHCTDSEPTTSIFESYEDGGSWALIDEECVVRGVKLIVSGDIQISPSIRASLIELLMDADMGISAGDAEMADCIVQAGVFGEIVYG